MGVLDTIIGLTALGAGMYFTIYYFLPALNQLSVPQPQQVYAQPAAPAAAPYVEPTPPAPVAEIPSDEPAMEEGPLIDEITEDEKTDLEDEVEKLKDIVEENEKDEEKPKKKTSTTTKKKSGGSTVENEATKPKSKGIKLPKGGSVIENEAAYAFARYYYRY